MKAATRFKIVRESKRMSLRAVAKHLGISPTTACRIEGGAEDLDPGTARKVSDFIGVCLCCGHPLRKERDDD